MFIFLVGFIIHLTINQKKQALGLLALIHHHHFFSRPLDVIRGSRRMLAPMLKFIVWGVDAGKVTWGKGKRGFIW
jgi:hypothetical protein